MDTITDGIVDGPLNDGNISDTMSEESTNFISDEITDTVPYPMLNNDIGSLSGKRIIFAVLAHQDEHVLSAQLANIRHFNPHAGVVLYNGGKNKDFAKDLDVIICPLSRPLSWAKQAPFLWDIMKWLEQSNIQYDYLVSLDHDNLFIKHGFESFLDVTMNGYDCMGWYMHKSYSKADKKHIVIKSMSKQWHDWKPFFRTNHFIQYFNPGQVYRHEIIKRMLSHVDWSVADHMTANTRVHCLEEVFPATLAIACGGRCREYPRDRRSLKAVRYWAQNITIAEAYFALHHPLYYWIHPVKRDALIRIHQWLLSGAQNPKRYKKKRLIRKKGRRKSLKIVKKKRRINPKTKKVVQRNRFLPLRGSKKKTVKQSKKKINLKTLWKTTGGKALVLKKSKAAKRKGGTRIG